ncbi:MAG: hypothetical protein HZC05_03545 [Candidatus Magasanikbacteria bacterium]|nr:hypothetical protein [Candidatus Magasanikbacteria bacterium]
MQAEDKNIKPLEGEVIKIEQSPTSAVKPGIFINTLNLVMSPAKKITKPLHRHYHRKYHGKYKHAKKIFILDMALVAVAVALLAASLYFFFIKPQENYLNISLKQNQQIKIGETQNFTFQLTNLTDRPLSEISIKFEFPASFVIKNSPPKFNPETKTLTTDLLSEKQTLDFSFQGVAFGAVNETQKIIIRAQFRETKKQTLAEQIATVDLNLSEPAITVGWEAPEKIVVGQNFNLTVNYKNNTLTKIEQVALTPTLPNDLAIVSNNAVLKDRFWMLENLEPNQSGQIQLIGFLRSKPTSNNTALTLQAFLINGEKKYQQTSLIKYLTVSDNGLNLSANLANDKNYLKPGEDATLKIYYQNKTGQTLKNINFNLNLPTGLPAGMQGLTADPTQLTKKEIALEENGTVEFIIKLSENFDAGDITAAGLSLRPFVSFYLADKPIELLRSFATTLNIKIASQIKLHAEARYFTAEGDQLGRGPLPPKVEQITKYWINWFVTTAPNSIKNVILLGRLPEGVMWTNKTNVTEGEPIKFDPVTRSVSWQSERVEVTPGGRCPCAGVGFEVAINPTIDDVGKILTLLNQLSIQAVDEATGEELNDFSPNVTTDLIKDDLAKGKGMVQ